VYRSTGRAPKDWKEDVIILLHKGSGAFRGRSRICWGEWRQTMVSMEHEPVSL